MGGIFSFIHKEVQLTTPLPESNRYLITKKPACVVIYFRYIGTGYHGLQYNEKVRTIDSDLFEGLEKSGILPEGSYKRRGKIAWNEASRTDAGVHACGQLICFKSYEICDMECSQIPELINKNLPSDSTIKIMSCLCTNSPFPVKDFATHRKYNYLLPLHVFSSTDPDHLDYLRQKICPLFIGQHNFHNYTNGTPKTYKGAQRFITDFTFGDVFTINGEEYVLFYIRGISFMLNQIRKMISMVTAASFNQVTPEEVSRSLTEETCRIQLLPGDGLFLDQIEYEEYMSKLKHPNPNNDIEFRAWRPVIEEWKQKVLFPHIAQTIKKTDVFRSWQKNCLLQFPVQFVKE
ncbi:tRNA pseudouridine synthase family protein [Trichomonas vaginalis G3]|uniref:tRNA pseudouridine synthase n=1 Tax=Trichomonas vaginalis (strain ATCC PRA-98 / G3) TaxID=412133 RepID=A2E6F9_TRIV3|nr:pseudouridine synthase protein [Trichomonas vaginalis G3]EAY11772.1 tRNA pseudouridine synthase family protein [Trichomonas vaginalis G3]KAI5540641.1 pseudouridine synthase protein [Trichomonas vaginalis G3]|eukprot:XP_001323995.1 tRNA pseudouridine synthase family protein [Trichomonas vaginalis G3]